MESKQTNTDDFNHIWKWLQPKLEERGWSIEEFANYCDLTKTSIYFYIHDTCRPNEGNMIKMCQVLGVEPQEGLSQYTPKRKSQRERDRGLWGRRYGTA